MTFTEVAFELADPRHPLCRMTRAPYDAHAVYRIVDTGENTRRHRAHLTYHGTPESAGEFLREWRQHRAEQLVDVVYQGPRHTAIQIEIAPDAAPGSLATLASTLASQGLEGALGPFVATEGRVRSTVVVPRKVDPTDVLRAVQETQRASGFAEMRVVRVTPVDPVSHVDRARRLLPPDHEDLLALATAMGYYETPKAVTLDEIARAVGLSISPVHKRLKAAEEALVQQHVNVDPGDAARRRARAGLARLDGSAPWELTIRARGTTLGPSAFVESAPGTRALVHMLSLDRDYGQTYLLVFVGAEEEQAKLVSVLQDRSEIVRLDTLGRDATHASFRIQARGRGAFDHSWWSEAWGTDGALRSIAYDRDGATMRVLLTRPQTADRIESRIAECARLGGWHEHEIVSLRVSPPNGAPPPWPEPLTARQTEVLRVANALGYYRTPRACTLEHVASTLGVSANAVHKNLVLAESKIIAAYLSAGL